MARIPPFADNVLEKICDILGDTYAGLTGSEIGELLHRLGIKDPSPTMTKRKRLFLALKKNGKKGIDAAIMSWLLFMLLWIQFAM